MTTYEIEIKVLLGDKEKADLLRQKIFDNYPGASVLGRGSQLNHYFIGSDEAFKNLENLILPILPETSRESLKHILLNGKKFSVRTRQTDSEVLFVVKASIDDMTSSNGVSRLEFESPVGLSLNELDGLLLDAGLQYQAKWSRDREEYSMGEDKVCIDKNAGYGYLAEFERVISDKEKSEEAAQDLRAMIKNFGLEELKQDRLERMFAYYNNNWPEYYGTDRIFVVE